MGNRWRDLAQGPLARVGEIRGVVESLDAGGDAHQAAELARLERTLKVVEQRFTGRRAELMPIGAIQDVNNLLSQTVSAAQQMANATAGGAAVNFEPVNDALDRALQTLAASPAPPATLKTVSDAANDFDEEASAIITRLQAQAQQIEADTASMRTDAERAVTVAQNEIAAAQRESSQAIEENARRLAELQGRVDPLIDNQQALFSEALEKQRGEFGNLVENVRTQLSEALQASKDATAARLTESTGEAAAVLAALGDMRKRAEAQLSVIGATGLAGGYKSSADRENRSRMWWRLATLAFGLFAVGFLIWAAAHASSGSASWIGVATKTGVAVAFGSLAAYSGRLAGKHHRRAAHYRDRELALASLGTYLESLDEPARGELMAELAPSFFSELREEHTKDDWPTQTSDLMGQLTKVLAKWPGGS